MNTKKGSAIVQHMLPESPCERRDRFRAEEARIKLERAAEFATWNGLTLVPGHFVAPGFLDRVCV